MEAAAPKEATPTLRYLTAAIGFLFRVGSEIVRVTGEVHHTVNDQPKLLSQGHEADIQKAPKLYRLIQAWLIKSSNHLHSISNDLNYYHPRHTPLRDSTLMAQSILNGVMGDKLHDWHHPSAISMHFTNDQLETISLNDLQKSSDKGVAIFIHGLCLSGKEWQNAWTQNFISALKAKGIEPIWLRYNSGLGISENGEQLAHLIENQWDSETDKTITFIGHSMGGLITRSAIYYAQHHQQQHWLNSVTHAAYVASPHEGAKLEKLGHFANSLLSYSPYTKPLMALGNIRSRGIRSLRHSNIEHHEEDSPYTPNKPFNHEIQHLVIGTRLPTPITRWLLGDGLVTDKSAMAVSHFPLDHEKITRIIIDDAGHMKILQDDRLYLTLALWLSKSNDND